MVQRLDILAQIAYEFEVNPVVAILGPRQVGKTTVAKAYIEQQEQFPKQNYFDCENTRDIDRLKDPLLALSPLLDLIVIDEIQYIRDLFPTLRVLVDDTALKQRFLILGSASGELIKETSETLAGRISYVELTPFMVPEIGDAKNLFIRGGFPRSYLANNEKISYSWRKAFIKTFLERDIPKLGINIPAENLRRFWMMLAHYHGNIFNASEIACSLRLSDKTVRYYVDILTDTFMIRQLKSWHENISKRQVKSSKIYIRDSGIFNSLLGIQNEEELLLHPKLGAAWEGFALEEITRYHKAEAEDCYFWATHQGAELDLLLVQDGKRMGFEFKYGLSPKLSKSMKIAYEDLKLDSLTVIYPGEIDYKLSENIDVVGIENYLLDKSDS